MTIQQITYFIKLAETGNFRQAASELYLSQPSLSMSIRKLEEEFGLPLFVRAGHRTILTPDGKEFLIYARRILQDVRDTQDHMSRIREERAVRIRIGCIASLFSEYLPNRMSAFAKLHGNEKIHFDLTSATTVELLEHLQSGHYDFAITSDMDSQEFEKHLLLTQPLVLVSPPDETPQQVYADQIGKKSGSSRKSLSYIGYTPQSAMDEKLRTVFRRNDVEVTADYRMPDEAAILAFVKHRFGWAICPWTDEVKESGLPCMELPWEDARRDIFLTVWPENPLSGAAGEFAEYLSKEGAK